MIKNPDKENRIPNTENQIPLSLFRFIIKIEIIPVINPEKERIIIKKSAYASTKKNEGKDVWAKTIIKIMTEIINETKPRIKLVIASLLPIKFYIFNKFKPFESRKDFLSKKWGSRESNTVHLRLQRSALPMS
ncbi:MAG: hypothetical protein AABW91_01585 [Nanoarchaeota archaeon]